MDGDPRLSAALAGTRHIAQGTESLEPFEFVGIGDGTSHFPARHPAAGRRLGIGGSIADPVQLIVTRPLLTAADEKDCADDDCETPTEEAHLAAGLLVDLRSSLIDLRSILINPRSVETIGHGSYLPANLAVRFSM